MKNLKSKISALFAIATQSSGVADDGEQNGNAFDFDFRSIDGFPLPLANFRGNVLLVVNTASKCGFTPQYKGLQSLWQSYRDQGLTVIGVPSNDFGDQEPGLPEEISGFCERNYGVTFPLTEKYHVKGSNAHPFYKWAATVASDRATPQWNFYKYLVARDGCLAAWFPTATTPTSRFVIGRIEDELQKAAS